jgi:hypothetical protein
VSAKYKVVMSDRKEFMITEKERSGYLDAVADGALMISIRDTDFNPRFVVRIEKYIDQFNTVLQDTLPVQDDMPKLTHEQREQAKMRLEEIRRAHQIKTGNANKK